MALYGSQYPYLQAQPMYLPNYCLPMTTLGPGSLAMYPGTNNIFKGDNAMMHVGQKEHEREVQSEPNRDSSSLSPESVPAVGESQEYTEKYMAELTKEKEALHQNLAMMERKEGLHVLQLLEREIALAESGHVARLDNVDKRMLDVYREKSVRVTVKVGVPVKEHPKFNFVGKLLGPKGNSLKRLQEVTLTKMAVLGKGSMRDKGREEELRLSKDPKYLHLSEDLHVEIVAFAPPAEAHARISLALTEVKKYLIPDSNDQIRQLQMKELDILSNSVKIISDPMNSGQLNSLLRTVSPMQTLQPLLVPTSASYLSGHLPSLLPTPPLEPIDTTISPNISAPPTSYSETEGGKVGRQESVGNLKMSVREEHRKDRRGKRIPY